jgi:DNA-binding SARP family transcriptional activator
MCGRNLVATRASVQILIIGVLTLFLALQGRAQTTTPTPDYGLSFASHEVTKDQRTSLALTPEDPFTIKEDFEIRFDLSLKRLIDAYGYVLRIIANDSINIDLVSSPEHDDFHDLNLIINNNPPQIHYDHQDIGLRPLQWTPVTIKFETRNKKLIVSWAGKTKTQELPFSSLRTFRFFFGANDFGRFNTSDVPPMIIRHVAIQRVNGKTIQWDLRRHGVSEVYDNTNTYVAMAKNPTWLIDKHTTWVHAQQFAIARYPSVAFNRATGTVYATDKNHVYTYHLSDGKMHHSRIRQGKPVYTDANQLLYIDETRTLVNYDLYTNVLSAYDFEHQRWQNSDTTYNLPNYWHNNKFYNPVDRSVYTFGGYGHFNYNNKFMRYDSTSHAWTEVKTQGSIPPRYLGALGLMASKNRALIFGGYGSESGKQELSPQSFYDLYAFDLKTHAIRKLWELKSAPGEEDIVFSNSLVVNEEDSCFYVLSFPKNKYENYIKLRKYSLSNPEWQVLADSIPFQFHDEHSFCDLFLSKATRQLVAVTSHKEIDQYKINLYTINYPPLSTTDVFQDTTPGINRASYYSIISFILITGTLITLGVIIFARRKKKDLALVPTTNGAATHSEAATILHDITRHAHESEKNVATIYLFGGFQVFDKQGHDITGKFTMTIKELFVLILIHSVKFEKGISTTTLQEYLWPDKGDMSARNNRNVNIKKLRGLLEEIGDITIENNHAYLQLALGENVLCDYHIVSRILSTETSLTAQTAETLLRFVKRGNLLPNIQTDWLDSFKSDISNRVIDVLLEYSQTLDVSKDDRVLLEIADTIFNYDSINQEALVIKCSVLNKKGKYSLAKTWYDHFVKEYKTLYAESYPKTFDEVIS